MCGRIDDVFARIVLIIALLLILCGECVPPDGSLERSPLGNLGLNDKLQTQSKDVLLARRVMRPLVEYGPGFAKNDAKPFDHGHAVNKLKNLFKLKWKLYGKPTSIAANKLSTTTTKPSTTTTKSSTTTTKPSTTSTPSTTTTKPSTTTGPTTTTRKTTTIKPSTTKSQSPTTKSKLLTTMEPSTTITKRKTSATANKTVTPLKVIVNNKKST